MSDTPRTDELDYNQETPSYRIWDLARDLERELEKAKQDNGIIITAFALENSKIREKMNSLIAAINTAITEHPSNQASIYLAGIMDNLFQK